MLAATALFLIVGCFVRACQYRANWRQFSVRRKSQLLLACGSLIAAYAFMLFSGWHFTFPLVNQIVGSLAVGAYSLLVLLLTLLRPKVLFYGTACMLLLAVPVSLVWMLLDPLYRNLDGTLDVEGNVYADKVQWNEGGLGGSGTTLLIYERPRFLPFLEHSLQSIVIDDADCISAQVIVVLQPDRRQVLARCPLNEDAAKPGFHEILAPLY